VTRHGNVTGALIVIVAVVIAVAVAMAVAISASMGTVAVTRSTGHIGVMSGETSVSIRIPFLVATTTTANRSYYGCSCRVFVFHRQLGGIDQVSG
jgi:archaellin